MEVKIKNETSELEILIAAKKEEWKNAQQNVGKDLAKNLSIKGFRKGKVPFDIAKKYISRSEITQKAVLKIIDSLAKKAMSNIDKKITILSAPSYFINKISDAELEIKFVYPIFPKFKIGNYKNLKIKFQPQKIDSQKIDEEIKKIIKYQTMLKEKNGPISNGDNVIFDYEGFINGKVFDGGSGKKFQLEIGSNKFIPGFEDKMIGLKANDKKNFDISFPNDYHKDSLQNKKATFKVLIHNVRIKEVPKLDDNFVKTSGIPNVKTVEELKKYIKKILEEQEYQKAISSFQRKALDEILKDTKNLVIPKILISQEAKKQKQKFLANIKQQKIKLKDYLTNLGIDEEQFNLQFSDEAIKRLKDAFIFGKISKLENIEVKDIEYEEEYKKVAKIYGQSIEQIKNTISKEQLQISMINNKIIKFLIKNIVES